MTTLPINAAPETLDSRIAETEALARRVCTLAGDLRHRLLGRCDPPTPAVVEGNLFFVSRIDGANADLRDARRFLDDLASEAGLYEAAARPGTDGAPTTARP